MTTDFYHLLISDCALAAVLLGLFFYVSRVSRGVRGIATWGVAHFVYSLGAAMLDGTAQMLERSGESSFASAVANAGGLLACAGLVGLAWSVIQFVRQRSLTRTEMMMLPLACGLSILGWFFDGAEDAQGAAMSAVEVGVLVVIFWQLRCLSARPDHVPARLIMLACVALIWLYARDLLHALTGRYGPNPTWVNADLSIWFMLNFCMLMLASFRAAETLRQSALFDPLTGALNRRGLDSELKAQGAPALSSDGGLAVIALDLDHFKTVNDVYGHDTGDQVLQRFSDVVRGCIRGDDLFVRLGGEEFMLVLRNTSPELSRRLAERIRQQVMTLEVAGMPPFQVTVSVGIAFTRQRNMIFSDLIRIADEALYEAKHNGRNRVEMRVEAAGVMG